jgi:uncharacterized protein (AIM24 family)
MDSSSVCRYCRQPSERNAPTCPMCGAPVDITAAVTLSGWTRQPPVRDMAHIQFGQSRCQIAGTLVPTAEFTLAQGDWLYFSHHTLLWSHPATQLQQMSMRGAWKRMFAGLPLVMMTAAGPGRIALSDNHAGDIVVLPLHPGQQVWVREHRFLCATGNVGYDWQSTGVWYQTIRRTRDGTETETHYPMGPYGDIFAAAGLPGLVLLHSPGNTFVRDLSPGETLLTQPSALLYRDVSVGVHMHMEYPRTGFRFWRSFDYRTIWIRLVGPGRVAVASIFERPERPEPIDRSSYATTRRW